MITTSSKKAMKNIKKDGELILSFTIDEEIIQFNKDCELFTGYQRDEVLHKKLNQILLPEESLEQWKMYLDSIRRTLHIEEFTLPLKTKHDETFLVSWNGILIRDATGSLQNICLFGTPQKMSNMRTATSHVIQMITPSRKPEKVPPPASPIRGTPPKSIPIQSDKRKMIFAPQKETKDENITQPPIKNRPQPLDLIEKNIEGASEKLESIDRLVQELTKRYDLVLKRLGDLEKKDWRSEKNYKNTGTHEHILVDGTRRYMDQHNECNNKTLSSTKQPLKKNKFTMFSDPFGLRRQFQELHLQKKQIETRLSELNIYEEKLMNERKMFNARIEEFCRWREKLELLETAIENRRQELMEQEEHLLNISSVAAQDITTPPFERKKIAKTVTPESHESLDKISQSAAIIQRGILKQINTPFADLLGYTVDEVVETSFFDLIAQDGLAGIEKYYLDRLKGESISTYKTVFLTKDENKVNVEVSIKQTIFNGEKAEIALIKNLENKNLSL
jgi:PAS domain S-box-containing protein